MIRIPEPGRFELRLADGAANPYLLQAGILAAGLDGIDNRRDPGKRLDINMYTDGHTATAARKLPLNLLDALRLFEGSKVMGERLGALVAVLSQAEARGMERLCAPPLALGAREHARLLSRIAKSPPSAAATARSAARSTGSPASAAW